MGLLEDYGFALEHCDKHDTDWCSCCESDCEECIREMGEISKASKLNKEVSEIKKTDDQSSRLMRILKSRLKGL